MFNIFKRSGKYKVPSIKPVDSAVKGKKNLRKREESAERLERAKKDGTETMLHKKEKSEDIEEKSSTAEEAGTVPPK